MSVNSLREQIIEADKALVEGVAGIKTVERRMQSTSDLKNFAITQFTVAAVVGRLPVPEEYKSGRTAGEILQVKSELSVDIYVYLNDNGDLDTEISNLADSLWVALLSDPTRGRLCLETVVRIEEETAYIKPYGAFKMTCIHKYIHSTGGI